MSPLWMLVSGLALAEEPAVEAPANVDDIESIESIAVMRGPEPPVSLPEVWAGMSPDALLQAAIDRRALGDVDGARERLQVLDEGGALPALAAYHLAVCDEIEEDYVDALAGYTTLIDRWPDLPLADDARFRRAVVLEDLGEHKQAVLQVRELERRNAWDARNRQSLALIRGAAELDAGRLRAGARRIQRELTALDGTDELTWARARAHLASSRALLLQAADIGIVNDGRARKRLVARVALLDQAMDQVITIGRLGEPEAALAGLLALGDAYQALHADLLAAPPPAGLSEEQVAIFREELAKQVDVLQVKAWRFYDEGVSLATRLQWQGHIAQELKARRASLSPPD